MTRVPLSATLTDERARALAQRYEASGFAQPLGMGRSPAVLLVDLFRAFTDPASPLALPVDETLEHTVRLLRAARRADVPVIHTIVRYRSDAEVGTLGVKNPVLRRLTADSELAVVEPRLEPAESDLIVDKKGASAFHASTLHALLTALGVDTVVVAGIATSGCVRATVVDAIQLGLRPIVVRECTSDRNAFSHEVALVEMSAKYADVEPLDAVIDDLAALGHATKEGYARRD